jgi:Mrp family chromosome partitioning ATPase
VPTNVTKPDWQCDTCRHRYGQNLAAAQRCESAPPAVPLPAGSLLLSHDDASWSGTAGKGFHLSRLYPLPVEQWHGTVATEWNADSGHFPYYLVGVDPAGHVDQNGVLRLPNNMLDDDGRELNGRQPTRYQGDWLVPHRPDVLQLRKDDVFGAREFRADRNHRGDGLAWITGDTLGMDVADAAAEADIGTMWARPLTEPVKAVLDALGITVVKAAHCSGRGWKWHLGMPLGAVAGERFRDPDGHVVREAAKLWLRTRPASDVAHEVNERTAAWRDGGTEPVPMPRLRAPRGGRDGRVVTYSKLTRELKKLVAATGVDWPERTDAARYAQILIEKALGYTVSVTDQLFATVPNVVAVGGGKGGVGKSTVAAALARRLAAAGRNVCLIDCDTTGPSQHLLHHLGEVATDTEAGTVLPTPTRTERLTALSPGQLFPPGASVHWNAQTIRDWITFMGTCVDLGSVDTVVLDLPPGNNATHAVIFGGQVAVTATVHVTTGSTLALADTSRSLATICVDRHGRRLTDASRQHLVVENLSRAAGLTSTGDRVEIRLQGENGAVEGLAAAYQVGYGGSLPWAADVGQLARSEEMDRLAKLLPLTGQRGTDERA